MVTELVKKWGLYAVIAVVLLALFRGNGSNLPDLLNAGWALFNAAADALIDVWHAVAGTSNEATP